MGVRRALESAEGALNGKDSRKIYSLGPLIHNEIALDLLSEKGLSVLGEDNFDALDEHSVVIIRAHGVAPQVFERLQKRGCEILDATCPRVLASQRLASKYGKSGHTVILAGDKDHGEVKGVQGFAGDSFLLVESVKDAEALELPLETPSILLSQTTFSQEEFNRITEILKQKLPGLIVFNTICSATKERQEALAKLCPEVDGMIVVGGKKSANTIRLYEMAEKLCRNAVHVSSAEEIPEKFFTFDTVGITAGASTPDYLIQEVEEKLSNSSK